MHRDIVSHIAVSKSTEFIVTASRDGHVKFWKKMADSIEFVKHYQAHLGPLYALRISGDDKMLVTTCPSDETIKFFDISGFDMTNMIEVSYAPTAAEWVGNERVAIAERADGSIRIYEASTGSSEPKSKINIHGSPVVSICLVQTCQVAISIDEKGVIEYWCASTLEMPSKKDGKISFEYKIETDLYDLAKSKSFPTCLATSGNGKYFALCSVDRQIRVFNFKSGKLIRRYDESISSSSNALVGMSTAESLRRKATERDLGESKEALSTASLCFDDSGNFLIFSTICGIKMVNLVTNKIVRIIGASENERFLFLALYQGIPKVDNQWLLSKGGAEAIQSIDELGQQTVKADNTIYATSFKSHRFFCFSDRKPAEISSSRDHMNELPSREDKDLNKFETSEEKSNKSVAVLHTSMGDIHIKLFGSVSTIILYMKFKNNIFSHYSIK